MGLHLCSCCALLQTAAVILLNALGDLLGSQAPRWAPQSDGDDINIDMLQSAVFPTSANGNTRFF